MIVQRPAARKDEPAHALVRGRSERFQEWAARVPIGVELEQFVDLIEEKHERPGWAAVPNRDGYARKRRGLAANLHVQVLAKRRKEVLVIKLRLAIDVDGPVARVVFEQPAEPHQDGALADLSSAHDGKVAAYNALRNHLELALAPEEHVLRHWSTHHIR